MVGLRYSDEKVEITCHDSRVTIHDRNSGKYFESSFENMTLEASEWEVYRPKLPYWSLYVYCFLFCVMLVFDYVWFFTYVPSQNFSSNVGWLLAIFLVANVVLHEFSHVLAMRLCGRNVDKIGFKLNYKVLPAFYVRMNQVILLGRLEKIFVMLLGYGQIFCVLLFL